MTLDALLDRSAATPAFAAAVRAFQRDGRPDPAISLSPGCPPVKVERVLAQLLSARPDLPIEAVEIDGRSGCEFFRGSLRVRAGGRSYGTRFSWNCRWKAQQLGWKDAFGLWDQARAAREYGYDCFERWEEVPVSEVA